MKKIILLLLTIIIVANTSCNRKLDSKKDQEPVPTQNNQYADQQSRHDTNLLKLENGNNQGEEFHRRIEKLHEDLDAGKIDEEAFHRQMELIRIDEERWNARLQNYKKADRLPDWTLKTGIKNPEGLELDTLLSRYTTVEDDGVKSVELYYNGPYEKCLSEAERITEGTNVRLKSDFAEMIEMARKNGEKIPGERAYTNNETGDPNIEINVFISVEELGRLIIHIHSNQ